MNELRNELLDRMIRIYGFEHEIVIGFVQMCESYPQIEAFDKVLEKLVDFAEERPQIEEENG